MYFSETAIHGVDVSIRSIQRPPAVSRLKHSTDRSNHRRLSGIFTRLNPRDPPSPPVTRPFRSSFFPTFFSSTLDRLGFLLVFRRCLASSSCRRIDPKSSGGKVDRPGATVRVWSSSWKGRDDGTRSARRATRGDKGLAHSGSIRWLTGRRQRE